MTITQELLDKLFEEAKVNPRLRTNLDLRTSGYMRKSFLRMVRLRLESLNAYICVLSLVPTAAKCPRVCGIR